MNEQVREQWVRALQSGNYTQGKNKLCTLDSDGNKSYCCLGVLTDLFIKTFPDKLKQVLLVNDGAILFESDDNSSCAFLIKPVMEWAGLVSDNPKVTFQKNDIQLSNLNDGVEESILPQNFNTIADCIEENL